MSLYEILIHKPCIWVLKELYDAEVVHKKVYTVKASDLQKYSKIANPEKYIAILHANGLIHVDDILHDKVISLNQKGKDFFKLFDKLKVLTESQVKIIEDRPIAKVEYTLTEAEKKALLTVHKITQEVGYELPINSLIIEDSHQDSAYDKLQQLNLIAKIKNPKGKGMTITLTPTGKRVLQQEFSEKLK
jgi:hypothetical protein